MIVHMRLSTYGHYWARRGTLLLKHHAFRQTPIRIAWRGLAWIGHCLLRRSAHIQIGLKKAPLELPPFFARGGCATAVYIFREEYEPELRYFESVLSDGMTVVDGGANIGLYSVIAAEAVGPLGHVLSFEPSQTAFGTLKRNIMRYTQVDALNAALTYKTGAGWLYHVNGATSEYSLAPKDTIDEAGESVDLVTLDDVCTSLSICKLDFVKLDVEGAEELVLRGSGNIFLESLPIVMFEVSERPISFNLSPQGAWLWLNDLGYTFWVIGRGRALEPQEWPPTNQNVIALPPLR
jgi:FkbM family methyltransferase